MFQNRKECCLLRRVAGCVGISFVLSCGRGQDSSTKDFFLTSSPGKRIALIIGATYQARPSWYPEPAMPTVRNDISSIAQMLSARGFTSIIVSEPTKAQMLNAIATTADGLSGTDTLFFYFSGHGTQNQDHVSFADPDHPTMDFEHEFFVMPPNSTANQPSEFRVRFSEVLSEFQSHLATPIKRLIWVDDSCHSGASVTGFEKLVSVSQQGERLAHPWFATQVLQIASSGYKEKSLATNGFHGGSLFTGAFLKTLKTFSSARSGSIESMFQEVATASTTPTQHPVFKIAPGDVAAEPVFSN